MSGASATFGLLFTGDETYAVIKQSETSADRLGQSETNADRPGGVAKAAAWCVVRAARWGPLVSAGGAERRAGMLFFLLVGVWL